MSMVSVGKDALESPALPTSAPQEGGKRDRKQKETEKSLDFLRLESQKKHKTKSVTFIKLR